MPDYLWVFSSPGDLRSSVEEFMSHCDGAEYNHTKAVIRTDHSTIYCRVIENLDDAYRLAGSYFRNIQYFTSRRLDSDALRYLSALQREPEHATL